jgi:hypothetical protein
MRGKSKHDRVVCRHCQRSKVKYARGLCWRCYHKHGVSKLYPPTSKYARRGVGNNQCKRPLPTPTAIPPGPERVAVLEERAARDEALWHPDDAALTALIHTDEQP